MTKLLEVLFTGAILLNRAVPTRATQWLEDQVGAAYNWRANR